MHASASLPPPGHREGRIPTYVDFALVNRGGCVALITALGERLRAAYRIPIVLDYAAERLPNQADQSDPEKKRHCEREQGASPAQLFSFAHPAKPLVRQSADPTCASPRQYHRVLEGVKGKGKYPVEKSMHLLAPVLP